MQHQRQSGVGGGRDGGGPQSSAAEMIMNDEHQKLGDLGIAEAASPISSRPPAAAIGNNNFEEMMRATAEAAGGSSGNRWPRQETLALLQIRSEMDAVFRDATLKGPLWEQVSRKLAELGYQRNAKKCKEKFENVHKYYKRTKESRGGRHDGKSYKFFNQLEALNTNTPADNNLVHHHHQQHHFLPMITTTTPTPSIVSAPPAPQPPEASAPGPAPSPPPPNFSTVGISFSSPSSSSSSDEEQEEDDEIEMELGAGDTNTIGRKRKRRSGGGDSSDRRMMEFFESLLKQVMQKQETMQQKFLQVIEKREKDRMIREEAWKRQDMARLATQHDLMAQHRSISASRDAAIIAFLEKITGQKIHLPHTPPLLPPPPPPPPTSQQHHHRQQSFMTPDQIIETHYHHRRNPSTSTSREIVTSSAMPEKHQMIQQQHESTTGMDITVTASSSSSPSSRWPKPEVLALIQLRSGMEHRYQETGVPKGPLWEEISQSMKRMGYNRNPKRCKEKWENINKYFKKVKDCDKKRPEDTKTCPYFHELDELYRKKILGNITSGDNIIIGSLSEQESHQVHDIGMMSSVMQSLQGNKSEEDKLEGGKNELQTVGTVGASPSTLFGEQTRGNVEGSKKPEAVLKQQHDHQARGVTMENRSNNIINGDDLDPNENDDDDSYGNFDENEEYDAKTGEEMKMVYKIQFQRQNNVGPSSDNGETTSSTSFMAMVQ